MKPFQIYLLKKLKTQAYNERMKIDIENINTFEKRKKYIQLNGGKSTKL